MKKIFILLMTSLLLQTSPLLAFEVESFDGASVNLQDKIGQGNWTLVMFWAHDCHVCREEFPLLSEFHDARDDVDIVGVSIDGEARKSLAQGFLNDTKPSFTSYITDVALVAVNYNALTEEDFRGTPTFLLFTPEGELLGNNPGKLPVEALANFIDSNS